MTRLGIAGLALLAAVLLVGGYLLLQDDGGPLLPGGTTTEPAPQEGDGFSLEQNQPNPFRDVTAIIFQIPVRAPVKLVIYNTLGAPVITLVDEEQDPGFHQVQWDGVDRNGNRLPGGVYFYQLTAGERQALRRMVLLP
jgi:FlgD Ig-like domain